MREIFQELSWIDWTALAVLVVFGVLGLFRGFLWQASRLASLAVGYVLAGIFARDLAGIVESKLGVADPQIAMYVAYFAIFVLVLVALSVVTLVLERFVKKLQLGVYNHLGGGLMGVFTGAALVVALLGLLFAVLPLSPVVAAAKESRTARYSSRLVEFLGFPDEIRGLFPAQSVETAETPTPGEDGEGSGR